MDKETITYYDLHSNDFFESTVSVKFSDNQDKFLKYLKQGMTILDFGCGSGRDTKYFIEKEYLVEATDGSEEMCKLAAEYTGIPVHNMMFEDFAEINKYHGVWACASILHLQYKNLKNAFVKLAEALKDNGVFYTSFKYSDFEGIRNERYFTDMTEEKLHKLLDETNVFQIEEHWITSDVRPEREDEKWLNVILRKKAVN